ncbi:MAG: hypothetical protein GX122_06365 [Candidatus Cloacimonetes bacterium]|nr:hypothetical protein [Candidatus Cloacimonadota bacterium]NLO12025.1 hypothetical protein [Candidatus Cloacimonadota bacterium]
MKKFIIIILSLLVLSGLAAAELKYWTSTAYLQRIPRLYDDGDILSRAATVFTPAANCQLQGVYFPFYGAGAAGQANVRVEIWPVNPDGTPNQSGMFPLAGETILYANLIDWQTAPVGSDYNYVDFSAANLYFGPSGANGTKFAMVVSSPNGVAGSVHTATLHDDAYRANSFNYFSTDPAGWEAWYDYCFSAEVEYMGEQIDVVAQSITFSGDFFLEPEEEVLYSVTVKNNSINGGVPMAVDDVSAYLVLRDQEEFEIVDFIAGIEDFNMAAGEEITFDLTEPYIMPADAGRYVLQFQAWHDDDVNMINNNLFLQQDLVELPFEFAYDEDNSTMAHAFYNDGFGFANTFWYEGAGMKITDIKIEMRDNTWPTGAQGNLRYAIFPDDGTGIPDMDNPLVPITQTTCQLGDWNTFDVSSYDAVVAAGEKFHVAYFQVGAYQAGAPGIMGDKTEPISSWITSLAYDPAEGWDGPAYYDEDLCIRVVAEEVVEIVEIDAPENVIIYLDGYPVVSWDEVEGAQSYNVYGSDDPHAPMSEWTLLEAGIQDLGYFYEGEEVFKFFIVTASTEFDGSKGRKASEPVALKAPKYTKNLNVIKDIPTMTNGRLQSNVKGMNDGKVPAGFGIRNLIKR